MTVQRLQQFGETIFATMTQLAVDNDAVNLGQGFPDSDGPARMLEIAQEQIASGNNQYAPLRGRPELIDALAYHYSVARKAIAVTAGATEAITATVLGLVEPGQEVIVLEPLTTTHMPPPLRLPTPPVSPSRSRLPEEAGTSTSMLCAPL